MLQFLNIINPLILGIIVCCAVYLKFIKKKTDPPGPIGLPFLGYIPFLGKQPHNKLTELAKKYGSVFSLYLGRNYVVVLSDYETVKDVLNKASASDRPPNLFHFLPDGTGLTNLSGTEWIEQRRYYVKGMKNIGMGKSTWEKQVEDEVEDFAKFLEKSEGQPLDIYKQLSTGISGNILSLLFGHRLQVDDPRRDIVTNGMDAFAKAHSPSGFAASLPVLADFLEKLGFNATGAKLEDIRAMNRYVRDEVEKSKLQGKSVDSVFIDDYLKEMKNNNEQNVKNSFTEKNLIGNSLSLIIGGSETTRISIEWLFLAMAAFPEVQDKVQKEVDSVLGKEGKAKWAERNMFPYTTATIMEGQRWRTVAPMNLLHRTNEDIRVGQYVIPKNTNIITLIWAIHNDPKYWKDPEQFIPERFLMADGKLVSKPESYIPFSIGKRICPGETVALIEIFLYFTSVMQKFRILPAEDGKALNLEGNLALTLQPTPQDLRFILRD